MDDCKAVVLDALEECFRKNVTDWNKIKSSIKDSLSEFLWKRTKRSPMILPIITEV
jgi:ribonuclease J